ncbi:MAG: Fic family protein [Bacteriovoracaceae bacterium]|nr:Fic family protein [Bacteriovoracaceae bacterium]
MVSKFNSGKFVEQLEYKSFRPGFINRHFKLNDADINLVLSEANRMVGELNAYSKLVPDVDFFIKMHVLKEATESSKIEGTSTEFDEALLKESDVDPERRDDWLEVINYTKAMNYAINELSNLPISMRLLKDTHRILLSGARGEKKYPGEIRTSQNWIGGTGLKDAFFIPPHKDELPHLLTDIERFWHNDKIKVPELIKAAIGHYQFETIHPFLDGNGRIGRLLITLYLIDKNILSKPTLYLSDFFARNKGQYFDALTVVRHSHDLKQWLMFFLSGVIETATKSKETFEQIIAIRNDCDSKILGLGQRAEKAKELIKYMYSEPILDINQIKDVLNTSHQTASSLTKKLEELGILRESTGFKRNKHYCFDSYIRLFM